MSQDGSSSKSYIKHPTEKARIEGLAFTSFPEDYLPYTSPTYQRKAPYLIWDQQQPYGVFRTRRSQQFRRYFCSTSALVTAIVLLVAAIIAIVAVSVYLGVITNLFRSPIFSVSVKLRILEGDEFSDVLLNQTSSEFSTKAEYYKALIENLLLSSSLRPAFAAARVYAFRHGSLLVFFRIHLDRRKLGRDDNEALLIIKSLLMEQAISSPSSSFDNLSIDLPSIDVREYGEEEWFSDEYDSLVPWEEADSLTQNESIHGVSSRGPTSSTTEAVPRLQHITTERSTRRETSTAKSVLQTVRRTDTSRFHLKNSSVVRIRTTTTPASREHGSVNYGYAEWRPIDLPQAIQVATLGDFNAPKKEMRPQQSSGFVKPMANDSPKLRTSKVSHESIGNVAPTIMSSVSLVILPNSKNRSLGAQKGLGSGFVEAVSLEPEHDKSLLVKDLDRKARIDDDYSFASNSESEEAEFDSDVRIIEIGRVYERGNYPKSESKLGNKSPETSTKDASSMTSTQPDLPSTTKVPVSKPEDDETTSLEISSSSYFVPTTSQRGLLTHDHEKDVKNYPEVTDSVHTSSQAPLPTNTVSSTEFLEQFSANSSPEATTTNPTSDHNSQTTSIDFTEAEHDFDDKVQNDDDVGSTLVSINDYSDHSLITIENAELQTDKFSEHSLSTDFSSKSESYSTEISEPVITEGQNTEAISYENQEDQRAQTMNASNERTPMFKAAFLPDVTAALELSMKTRESQNHSFVTDKLRPSNISNSTERTNFTFLEDLQRFRKIVQPFSQMNPNDINSEDDFKHPIFTFHHGFPSTLPTSPVTISDSSDIGINRNPPESTHGPENQSSIVGFGKNPIFSSHRCTEDEMFCGSGECVPTNYRCNMRRDCRDNSDEQNCTCSDYLTIVGQSQKICDGITDCSDYSDELNCPWCSPEQFLCPQSKFCINMDQVCDGSNDCPFGTDERYCVKLAKNEQMTRSNDYSSEGHLMVRKNGKWGKLCLDPVQESAKSDITKLEELGRAVCSALTYRELKEAKRVHDDPEKHNSYYEIKSHSFQAHQHNRIFKPTTCKSEDVIHVKCNSLECGLRPMAISSSRRRIVGGQTTGSGSWPWQVALYKEGDFQCGAVLISDSWLLSAGHCFYSTQTAYWSARLGILRRGTELQSPVEKVRHIRKIILHPEYIDKGFINDIALLMLDEPVPFSDYLRPLCLPTASEDVKHWHGQHCSVVGWGKLFEIGHTFPDSLQEVRLPVISTEECRKRIVFLSMYHITDNMFCAGFERGGRDACLGDSGGPLMCQRQDGRWVLLGITSNGDGCGRPGRPGVYTKVTQYLKWIDQTMNSHNHYPNSSATCLGLRCPLGRCLQTYKICDGRYDCVNGSDESSCPILPML